MIGQLLKTLGPELAIELQPLQRRVERLGLEPAAAVLAIDPPGDQTGVFEDAQMPGNGRRRDWKPLSQPTGRHFAAGQHSKNFPSRRIGQCRKRAIQFTGFFN